MIVIAVTHYKATLRQYPNSQLCIIYIACGKHVLIMNIACMYHRCRCFVVGCRMGGLAAWHYVHTRICWCELRLGHAHCLRCQHRHLWHVTYRQIVRASALQYPVFDSYVHRPGPTHSQFCIGSMHCRYETATPISNCLSMRILYVNRRIVNYW